ncbi:MAG: XdhC family protein [Chromatiales bacterium]
MDRSGDREVLQAALEWLEAGDPVVLVTVARTWGSSPRRPGALMAIHADGRFCGSVSGGCVEDDLAQRVMRGEFEQGLPQLETYGVRAEQAQRVGLPCGGSLSLLLETLESPLPLHRLLEQMDAGRRLTRRICLDTGEASLHPADSERDLTFDGHNLCKTFGPRWRLLLIGAGELTRRLAQLALSLDFAVTLCDPRPEYAADPAWQVAGSRFTSQAPAEALAVFRPDQRSAVLALAHTPALDDAVLAGALGSEAFYVGALGSQKSQQARCRRLQRLGISAEQLEGLHGPVGLAIGSRTPAEIAVAIAAALVQARNEVRQKDVPKDHAMHA